MGEKKKIQLTEKTNNKILEFLLKTAVVSQKLGGK
jgi:hypothetical protein